MPYLSHTSEVASMVLEKVTDEGKGNFMQIVFIRCKLCALFLVFSIALFILYGDVQVHVHV